MRIVDRFGWAKVRRPVMANKTLDSPSGSRLPSSVIRTREARKNAAPNNAPTNPCSNAYRSLTALLSRPHRVTGLTPSSDGKLALRAGAVSTVGCVAKFHALATNAQRRGSDRNTTLLLGGPRKYSMTLPRCPRRQSAHKLGRGRLHTLSHPQKRFLRRIASICRNRSYP